MAALMLSSLEIDSAIKEKSSKQGIIYSYSI